MKVRKILSLSIVFLGLLVSVFLSLSLGGTKGRGSKLPLSSFFQKKRVTIAVTDSGLGGLSVVAEAVRKMKETGIFKRVDFVFFNALFSNEGGYNSLKTREEKIRVFSSALESQEKKCRPDIILIGCNTLSTLYEDTPYSRQTKIPVIPIVQAGVGLIARGLEDHPEASVIIFGTPTTISEGTYPRELEKQGFAAERIHTQSCAELESFIENDPRADETGMLISGFVSEAVQNIRPPLPPLLVSLNCTHYGYSLSFWEKAFEEAGITPLAILNPNPRLTDVLFEPKFMGRYQKTEVTVRVVSMVEISRQKIDSLATLLERLSPETAEALRRYEHRPSLFEWKRHIAR
jgi:glutamate racemase